MLGRTAFAVLALGLLEGCAGDMLNDNLSQMQNTLVLEPHPSGAPKTYRLMTLENGGSNREAERMASLRYLTRGTCPAPKVTPEASVPAGRNVGGPMDRKYWRVEC